MKRKEVEDVMGGANAWENVDKADGMFDLVGGVGWCWGSMCRIRGVLRHGDIQHNVPEKDVMGVRLSSTRCRSEARTSL